MTNYEITIEQYRGALREAMSQDKIDSAYVAHLVNDYRIMNDGKVIARWSVDKSKTNCYVIRDRFKLFSSL